MAKVTFIVPIEELHGKIRGNFGAAQRAEANDKGNRDPYTVFYGKRKSQPSSAEVAQRTKFGDIAKLAKLRRMDETKSATDLANFKAQSTYKTYKAYCWHVAETEYNTAHA